MLLMCTALLGSVLCGSITYDPHKSPSLRDPAAQTADREIQSAGPLLPLSSAITSLRVMTVWAQLLKKRMTECRSSLVHVASRVTIFTLLLHHHVAFLHRTATCRSLVKP